MYGVNPLFWFACAAPQEQLLRSTSHQLCVSAGPAASAVLEGHGSEQEQFSISNGRDAAARQLLRNAAVQLVDNHSNAAAVARMPVRWRLLCGQGSGGGRAEAPQLCCSAGQVQLESDERGRAFFGDVAVEEGSGRLVSGVAFRTKAPGCCLCGLLGCPEGHAKDPPVTVARPVDSSSQCRDHSFVYGS